MHSLIDVMICTQQEYQPEMYGHKVITSASWSLAMHEAGAKLHK
jgi:hypothetical protein